MATFNGTRSGIFDSVPPGPGPAKCKPDDVRKALGDAQGEAFNAWCIRHGISIRDLASILRVTVAVAWKKFHGHSPLTEVDIAMFPERYEAELRIELAVVSRNHRSQLRAHG